MALPSSGKITLANLQSEFGGSNPISMSEYYRNGGLVPSNNTNVPTSGTIALSNFYGAVNEIVVTIGNGTNISLSSYFGGNWGSSVPKRARLTGTIGSSNGSAALTINGGMGGTLRIENSGSIQGTSGSANSGGGGSAVYCDPGSSKKVTFVNTGTVYAGGGGGGKGGKGGTGGGGYYTYTVWQRVGDGGRYCDDNYYDCNSNCSRKHSGTMRCQFGSGNRDECWNYYCEKSCSEYDSDDYHTYDCNYYDPKYCDDCQRLNSYNTNTNGGGGGAGGNGGRGQGYGVSRANGSGGSGGANGGANAGRGGTGGTGGAGGTWGAAGATGARGATGNSGNRTGGSGGSNGSGGGAAGYYIQNRSGMSISGSGYAGR